MRKRDDRQLQFDFAPLPPPMIPGSKLMFGQSLWYDWRTCCWVKTPNANCWKPT